MTLKEATANSLLMFVAAAAWARGSRSGWMRWGSGCAVVGRRLRADFCPTSAALFFGSLVPLSLKVNSSVALPVVYGIGTALPVMIFAVLLATSAQSVGKAYNVLAKIEWWAAHGHRLDLCIGWYLLRAEIRLSGVVSIVREIAVITAMQPSRSA